MNKYRVSATRFTCGMFKRTGRKKQSRRGSEGHSLDEGHSQGATPASCSGCQVKPASRVGRTFSGTGQGLHEERSSPSLPAPPRSWFPPSRSWPPLTRPCPQAQALCWAPDDTGCPTVGPHSNPRTPAILPASFTASLPTALHRDQGQKAIEALWKKELKG